jgi:hypothetical protein
MNQPAMFKQVLPLALVFRIRPVKAALRSEARC